jgi:hypothetical protein
MLAADLLLEGLRLQFSATELDNAEARDRGRETDTALLQQHAEGEGALPSGADGSRNSARRMTGTHLLSPESLRAEFDSMTAEERSEVGVEDFSDAGHFSGGFDFSHVAEDGRMGGRHDSRGYRSPGKGRAAQLKAAGKAGGRAGAKAGDGYALPGVVAAPGGGSVNALHGASSAAGGSSSSVRSSGEGASFGGSRPASVASNLSGCVEG